MDLVVLETPGHTPGQRLLLCGEGRHPLLRRHAVLRRRRTQRPPGGSEKKLRESIQKKIAVLPPETRVFPGHGPFTTVEREKRGNAVFPGNAPEAAPVAVRGLLARSFCRGTGALADRPGAADAACSGLRRGRPSRPRPHEKARGGNGRAAKRQPPGRPPPARKQASARAGSENALGSGKRPARALRDRKQPRAARPATPAGAARRTVRAKRPVSGEARKAREARSRPEEEAAQATRSTKAPGAGRKPAR